MQRERAFSAEPPPLRVVFVCTGNQARSPLAEALLRERVAGLPVEVESFGTEQLPPSPPLRNAERVGSALGVDLRSHRSRPLAPGGLDGADLIIGFEQFHIAAAVVDAGAPRTRSFLLRELAELLDDGVHHGILSEPAGSARIELLDAVRAGRLRSTARALPDPAGSSLHVFKALAGEIDDFTRRLSSVVFGVT